MAKHYQLTRHDISRAAREYLLGSGLGAVSIVAFLVLAFGAVVFVADHEPWRALQMLLGALAFGAGPVHLLAWGAGVGYSTGEFLGHPLEVDVTEDGLEVHGHGLSQTFRWSQLKGTYVLRSGFVFRFPGPFGPHSLLLLPMRVLEPEEADRLCEILGARPSNRRLLWSVLFLLGVLGLFLAYWASIAPPR